MRRPAFAVGLLCLVALWPVLRTESPCTHDGGLHYHRVVAMDHALRDGVLFTRYLPDLAYGYGYPFFNYREPASYYVTLALFQTGLPLPLVLNLVYVASILGCALGAYLLARDLFGPTAGVIAAVGYAYAPYQFLDALLRGNATESVALALLPLILWALRRLALTGRRRYFLLSAGSLAALYLTHYISSLIFTPLLLGYLAVLWLVYRRAGHWGPVIAAVVIAAGLASFCVAPALLEQNYVQLHMSRVTRNNDFHYNFLGLAEIFAPPTPVDTSLMNPPMRVHLGLVLAIIGAIGLVSGLIRLRDREQRGMLMLFALAFATMLWMSTRSSVWLWDDMPLLPFVQFPWRFIGRAVLPLALTAAAAFGRGRSRAGRAQLYTRHLPLVAFHASVALLIASAFPDTYPPQGYCPSAPYPTVNDVFSFEHRSGLVGVDPEGSYFPVWVKQRPQGSPLEAQYAANTSVARFDDAALPEGGSVSEADYDPNRARLVLESPISFRARYLAFYFPGWHVKVDGKTVPVTPSNPEGLITFEVPAGRHTVTVRFGETPLRAGSNVISVLSVILLGVTTLWWTPLRVRISSVSRSRIQPPGFDVASPPAGLGLRQEPERPGLDHRSSPQLSRNCSWSLPGLAILLLVLKLGVVDRVETVFRRPGLGPDGALPGVDHRIDRRYADGLALLGFSQDRASIPSDGVLRLDLYWRAYAHPSARYQSVIHLVGPDGVRWSQPDSFRPRGYADHPSTRNWDLDHYALDSHEVEPLVGTPPGTYNVVLTVFDRDDLAPLSVLNEQSQPAAPGLTLGQVGVAAPIHPTDPAALGIRYRLDTAFGPLTLLGAHLDRDEAWPGDLAMLTLFWRASEATAEEGTVYVALVGPDDSVAADYDLPTTASWHPTSLWQPGDVWRGRHMIRFPAGLESGEYTWHLSVEPLAGSAKLPWTTTISAPDRTFALPTFQHVADTTLGGVATLGGFSLSANSLQPGGALTVTLVWRAEKTPLVSYHAFLHLLDSSGRLFAQSDGIPVDWTRPTTGWIPGEYVSDVHVLALLEDTPMGDYTLFAGLYAPGSARLAALDGTDAIPLVTLSVEGG